MRYLLRHSIDVTWKYATKKIPKTNRVMTNLLLLQRTLLVQGDRLECVKSKQLCEIRAHRIIPCTQRIPSSYEDATSPKNLDFWKTRIEKEYESLKGTDI